MTTRGNLITFSNSVKIFGYNLSFVNSFISKFHDFAGNLSARSFSLVLSKNSGDIW